MFSSNLPAGVLHVTLVEGRKLHDEDLVGKGDPYVELWLDNKYKQKSDVKSNTSTPVWNQEFTFNIGHGASEHKLHFSVLDKDTIGSDKIGTGKLDVRPAINDPNSVIDTWVNLPAKLGLTSHGELHIRARFDPRG